MMPSNPSLRLSFIAPPSARQNPLAAAPRHRPSLASRRPLAIAIPGDSLAESVAVNGTVNFLDIYGNLLVGRVLLSFFPNLQVRCCVLLPAVSLAHRRPAVAAASAAASSANMHRSRL